MSPPLRPYLASLCLAMSACAVPAVLAGFSIHSAALLAQASIALALGLLLLAYTRLRRAPSIQLGLEAALWSIGLSSTFNFPMHLILSQRATFADAALARADAALGFNVAFLVKLTTAHPVLSRLSDSSYASLHGVSILAILLPALTLRRVWLSELLLALGLSIVASLLILTRLRAIGPWVGGGFLASAAQAQCEGALRAVEFGARLSIDVSRSAPFIALPSWHVILAVLSAHALGRYRGARVPALIWCALVCVSTLTSGWHYGVDVASGLAVAGLALAASKGVHRHWAKVDQRRRATRFDDEFEGLAVEHPALRKCSDADAG